jgi:hypothetical protein
VQKATPVGTSSIRRHGPWVILIGLVVAALVIVGFLIFSSDSSGVTDQQRLASVQRVCGEWTGNSAPRLGTSSASTACALMADWMDQQLRNGDMTGPMMWGSATTMGSTCRQWMRTQSGASITTPPSLGWCNNMVNWMEQHINNWDDWMMNGNMMGGASSGNGSGT